MNIFYQYAVKFVCGKSEGNVMAPGRYWTAVNVHNPTRTEIRFRKKVAVALPSKPGPISPWSDAKLGPDEALEIDCPEILERSHQRDFAKGFVVIESQIELDIVAVYTASGGDELVETIHTERVPARRFEAGLPDLVPVPDDNGSFCRRKGNDLIVTVRNQGTAGAGPSVTEVDFRSYGVVSQPTPALAAGASVDLVFPIPGSCFDTDCEFDIRVDVTNVVAEADEGNNFASDKCTG